MHRRKIVFLDLEDTIIDNFASAWGARLVNLDKVRGFLVAEQPQEVRIFSFAILDKQDKTTFRKVFQEWLETNLGMPINGQSVFAVEDLYQLCKGTGTVFEDKYEAMLFHGKTLGFLQFIRLNPEFADLDAVLLDDAVEPMTVELPRRNVGIRLVNVEAL